MNKKRIRKPECGSRKYLIANFEMIKRRAGRIAHRVSADDRRQNYAVGGEIRGSGFQPRFSWSGLLRFDCLKNRQTIAPSIYQRLAPEPFQAEHLKPPKPYTIHLPTSDGLPTLKRLSTFPLPHSDFQLPISSPLPTIPGNRSDPL
jgi:hypothetical protein